MTSAYELLAIVIFYTFCVNVLIDSRRIARSDSDRPIIPEWFDQAKFGIFIHWGVFSVPSYGGSGASEWFWKHWQDYHQKPLQDFMKANYRPGFTYPDFASEFTAEFYSADSWADLLQASGAKYVVITTKHHEGYCLWNTSLSFNWNSLDVGPHKDLVGELAAAVRQRTGLKFGIYHSLYEWFNELYLLDKSNNFSTQYFSLGKTIPELYELVNAYKPDVIWSDGEWEASASYWNSSSFIEWLYTESPVKDSVVVNNRWGANGPQGDYKSFENQRKLIYKKNYKWENAITLDPQSWGYRREATLSEYMATDQILLLLIQAVSHGGNLLLNIGPTKDGRILPLFEERLREVGGWLKINGEAIYNTTTWKYQVDKITPYAWYTLKKNILEGDVLYVIITDWPANNQLQLQYPKVDITQSKIRLLGYDKDLKFSVSSSGLTIMLPQLTVNRLPCKHAWTLKIVGFND